ncbi:MAG: sulfatase-like hydrolase/transferase [Acidobacteria bacterium]|nr:sulfatase-like hydrolase/transferase [Acidobacteriota bacterium]
MAAVAADTPVFIISIDTLRADHLPAYGYANGSTPEIDRFRKDAVLFRSAFSHVPLTLPSHASLMTGLLPYRHGVRDNVGYVLKEEQTTLAAILKRNGYATGAAVSSFVIRGETGIERGFDEYDDLMTVSPMETLTSWTRDGDLSRELLAKWLEKNAGPRVFAFLHIYEPHGPYTPPEPYKSRFAAAPYDGEVAYSDAIVGKFLDELRAKGLYDRALIILMSDHGEGLGDHGEIAHGVLLYNEAIQVPLMIKLPAGERAGQEVATVASIVDILPTVLARLGIGSPTGLDGVDLFGATAAAERAIYSESYYQRLHYGWKELISLVDAKHHFIEAPTVELYDRATDPREMKNIASDQRRVVADRRRAAQAVVAAHPFEQPRAADPEDVAKLTALGYLGSGPSATSGDLPDPKDKLDALTLMGKGTAYIERGHYSEALEVGRTLVRDNPDFLHGWGLLSSTYLKMEKYDLALAAFEEQMKRSASPQVAMEMANIYMRLRRYDEARKHAELALSFSPAFAGELLAQIAFAEGRLDVAEAEAEKVLAIEPERVQPLMMLSEIRNRQQRFAEELEYLDRTKTIVANFRMPPIRELELRRGEALLRLRRVGEAEAALRAETDAFPDNARAWSSLALVVGAQGRGAEARAILETATRTNPGRGMEALARQTLRVIEEGERQGR